MKYLVSLFLLFPTVTIFSQSFPLLLIHKTDTSITTIPLNEIDSLVHKTIVPIQLLLFDAKNVTNTSAIFESRIQSKGEGTIGEYGFCWSTLSNPTITSNKVICTSKDGINFSFSNYGQTKNTTYFVRSFAYNEAGISYSNQIECLTLNQPDIVLETVKIGFQNWTSKNLDISTYRNGDPIRYASTLQEWLDASTKGEGAWCFYNNDPKYGEIYGKLYNWYAVNDPRGLAPVGHHIPSDAEWSVLTEYLGGDNIAGKKLKSTTGWQNDGNGDNTSGFDGLPGGYYKPNGSFYMIEEEGHWWSSTENDTLSARRRDLNYRDSRSVKYPCNKNFGLSVRCLRD